MILLLLLRTGFQCHPRGLRPFKVIWKYRAKHSDSLFHPCKEACYRITQLCMIFGTTDRLAFD